MTQTSGTEFAVRPQTSTIQVDAGTAEPEESSGSMILSLRAEHPAGMVTREELRTVALLDPGALGTAFRTRTTPSVVSYEAGPAGIAGSVGDLLSVKGGVSCKPSLERIIVSSRRGIASAGVLPQQLEPSLSAALARIGDPSLTAATLKRAQAILLAARQRQTKVDCVSVTRSMSVAITLMRGRRYAILEADQDGDVVLTLTDRARDAEADTEVVQTGREDEALTKAAQFLVD